MEATVHRQQVCLHTAFLMRSHELCASGALDKHTSDATGKKVREGEVWGGNRKMDRSITSPFIHFQYCLILRATHQAYAKVRAGPNLHTIGVIFLNEPFIKFIEICTIATIYFVFEFQLTLTDISGCRY